MFLSSIIQFTLFRAQPYLHTHTRIYIPLWFKFSSSSFIFLFSSSPSILHCSLCLFYLKLWKINREREWKQIERKREKNYTNEKYSTIHRINYKFDWTISNTNIHLHTHTHHLTRQLLEKCTWAHVHLYKNFRKSNNSYNNYQHQQQHHDH